MPDHDPATIEEMREQVERLATSAETLRRLGEREDVPAVERSARRVQGLLATIEQNLPPEVLEEE